VSFRETFGAMSHEGLGLEQYSLIGGRSTRAWNWPG
jgi:hypothetical protein